MNEAVFISDLHLHPAREDIQAYFEAFVNWACRHTRAVYILGDFFHVWAGDDTMNAWSEMIARRLADLTTHGVKVYFLRGNRDFLLGKRFFKRANVIALEEPALITLAGELVMLVHGDRYCTQDKAHQRLRRLTRNCWFPALFQLIPKWVRLRVVLHVRHQSEMNTRKIQSIMQTVPSTVLAHLKRYHVKCVVHGHTHQPGLIEHTEKTGSYRQYILSDWDSPPAILCYNKSNGLYFRTIGALDERS